MVRVIGLFSLQSRVTLNTSPRYNRAQKIIHSLDAFHNHELMPTNANSFNINFTTVASMSICYDPKNYGFKTVIGFLSMVKPLTRLHFSGGIRWSHLVGPYWHGDPMKSPIVGTIASEWSLAIVEENIQSLGWHKNKSRSMPVWVLSQLLQKALRHGEASWLMSRLNL